MVVRVNREIRELHRDLDFGEVSLRNYLDPFRYSERVDYCLDYADGRPFIYLRQFDDNKFHALSWLTTSRLQDFYGHSRDFYEKVIGRLGHAGEGSVGLVSWGQRCQQHFFSLDDYLQGRYFNQFLENGFPDKFGELGIRTPSFLLRLGHFSRQKRVLVYTQEDLAEELAPLVAKTGTRHFQEGDTAQISGLIAYLTHQKIFQDFI